MSHDHLHCNGHSHAPADFSRAFVLNIWAASTTENVLTAHLVMPGGGSDDFLHLVAEDLRRDFTIHHITIQIEAEDTDGLCHLENTTRQGACWPGKAGMQTNANHTQGGTP